MTSTSKQRLESRKRRHHRVRKKITGTPDRPRLAVFRSSRHLVLQVIDDEAGHTLAAASTVEPDVRSSGSTGTVDAAARVGTLLGERARAAGVAKVVFDRGGFAFHGRIKAAADAAREAGLEF